MAKIKQKALDTDEPCTGYPDCEFITKDGLCPIDPDECPVED